MALNYDKAKLISVLNDFYNITGLNIVLRDSDSEILGKNEIYKSYFCDIVQSNDKGLQRCNNCDKLLITQCIKTKTPHIHTCHAGLTDMAIPVVYNNEVIAIIILGQIKQQVSFKEISEKLVDLNLDNNKLFKSFNMLPEFNEEKINSIINLVVIITEHILLNDMLKPSFDRHVQLASKYILENIDKEISVSDICKNVNISKSVLYKSFNKHLNTSPNKYINNLKINKAKQLLLNSSLPLKTIATMLGFNNINYFYNLFKKETGFTPTQIRKRSPKI